MKKLILILAIISVSLAQAQKINTSEVPAAVTSKFAELYPTYKVTQWKKEKGNYEAKFMQTNTKMCVVMGPGGNLVRTTTGIEVSDLPVNAKDYLAKNYKNEKIAEASKTMEMDGQMKYEAKVKATHLCFDAEGNYVKSEKRNG